MLFLYRAISHGQPAPDRIEGAVGRLGDPSSGRCVEVFGQKKLLKWTIPGTAHFFVFWAFLILGTVYLEAYAVLLSRDPEWNWFVFGNWAVLGFLQDFIAVMCLLRHRHLLVDPDRATTRKNQGRKSRFFGSHLGPAYFTLFMIFNVLWTLFLFRGAVEARDMGTDNGYGKAAFVSYGLGQGAARQHRPDRHRPAAAHRRDAGLPDLRAELQAPAHLRGPAQRDVRSRRRSPWARRSR